MDNDRAWLPPQPQFIITPAGQWIEQVHAPGYDRRSLHMGRDDHGNSLIGKWLPGDLGPDRWQQIKQATLSGELGISAKVLDDYTTACVYTRDYRDLPGLRRVIEQLRRLGCHGQINYKRDADTARKIYGRGEYYWYSPAGTVLVLEPKVSRGREKDATLDRANDAK